MLRSHRDKPGAQSPINLTRYINNVSGHKLRNFKPHLRRYSAKKLLYWAGNTTVNLSNVGHFKG